MTINPSNLAAVHNDENILGYLTWYSIFETIVDRTVLLSCLQNSGLGEDWMPKVPSVPDAFRKATKQAERKRVSTSNLNIHHNYLVRDVGSDKDRVQRNIVLEVVDSNGKKLDYRPEEAVLILDKKTGLIDVTTEPGVPKEIAEECVMLFEVFKTNHDARAIRSMVCLLIKTMAPTPVRPAGGVYFIPLKFKDQLEMMVKFLRYLPGETTEAFMIPVIDTTDNRDMVRQKLFDHLKDTLKSLKDGLQNPKLDKGNANVLLDDAKRRLEDFKEYQYLLQDQMSDMEEVQSFIKLQMTKLLDKDF